MPQSINRRAKAKKSEPVSKPMKAGRVGMLLDNQKKICDAYRAGKKVVMVEDRPFGMRKITHKVRVTTKANPDGVNVLEHWLVVVPLDNTYPRANIPYPARDSNSRVDLV